MQLLSDSQIQAGRVLLERLDRSFGPDTALWYYFPADEEWKLIFADGRFLKMGPREGYRLVQKALAGGLIEGAMIPLEPILQLKDVILALPSDRLITTLRKMIRTSGKVSDIRLTRNVIDGLSVEDAYIYRLK